MTPSAGTHRGPRQACNHDHDDGDNDDDDDADPHDAVDA